MKRNPNLLYLLHWLWNWTSIWKVNGESSWFFSLGFRFELSLNLFEVFTSIHRLLSILNLRWWFKVQDEEVLWIYLDFNGGSNENPWENFRFFFFSLSLSLWSHWFVRWMIQCWNCRGFWFDDEDSLRISENFELQILIRTDFATWLLDWVLCDEIDENLWWFGVDLCSGNSVRVWDWGWTSSSSSLNSGNYLVFDLDWEERECVLCFCDFLLSC